jgi:hypothetical protein
MSLMRAEPNLRVIVIVSPPTACPVLFSAPSSASHLQCVLKRAYIALQWFGCSVINHYAGINRPKAMTIDGGRDQDQSHSPHF